MPRATSKSSLSGNVDVQVVNNQHFSEALSDDAFKALLAPFLDTLANQKSIAVAVSGGADSMALCLLADRWAKQNSRKLVALTVDHGLRANAAKEAQEVAGWLAVKKITHHILTWQGEKPNSGIQAAARKARYHMMASWCQENAVSCLMVAHHLEDQAETFLLRAERGSGLDGLACMAPVVERENIKLLRPLLSVSKHQLRGVLKEARQNWIEDPSNQNSAYRRTTMRALLAALGQRNLAAEKIGELARQFSILRRNFEDVVSVFFERAVRIYPEGYGRVQLAVLQKLPNPVLERVLVQLALIFGGKNYPPRRDRLKRAALNLHKGEFAGFTLGGCRFLFKGHDIMICRETRGLSATQVRSGDHFNWHGLFEIEISGSSTNEATLAPLGKRGWFEIVQKKPELKEISLPYSVRLTLPTLSDERGIIEVPQLGFRRPGHDKTSMNIAKVQFKILKSTRSLRQKSCE